MIQRIQSLFLLLSAVAVSMLFFFPLASYTVGDMTMRLGIGEKAGAGDLMASTLVTIWPLMIGAIIVIIISIAAIFLFRRRRQQMKVVMIAVFLNMILIIAAFITADRLEVKLNNSLSNYEFGAFLPVASLVFLMLAFRNIKKDERLVRSADRLR